ncbi:histidine phosphatase family containing protein [Rhizoctonia solani AG-3 Rhs1AP]|uniref:Histidine phosphatase family containing protein n=1 Tax=Rhizoctonia solani AG-3 Rhs1AP TaxID=1086054 RepID=X8JBZ7_9AGAM|nr:histidine phosphatase family containing protein [Rhizoctonia solani AG-3 Rhs1AP]
MTSKRVYLLRHGQAEHNVANDFSIHDALLTPAGRQQCIDFAQANPDFQNEPQVILTSAFRRTLSTTLLAMPQAFERLMPQGKVILLPQLQETHAHPCDTGSDRAVLEQMEEYKDRGFDWSPLTDDWNKNQGFYAATPEALAARGRWVRRFVRDRPESEILLVGHGGIFREIDGRMKSSDPAVVASLSRWGNVECRVYTFQSEDDDDAVMIPIMEPSIIQAIGKPVDPHVELEVKA